MNLDFTHLKKGFFLFFISLVIGIILIVIFNIMRPEKQPDFNFEPVPTVSPQFLPQPKLDIKCSDKIQECNDGLDSTCETKCGSEYTCTYVENDGQYVYNGIKIPQGKWCLPSFDEKDKKSCNIYTGRWTWSAGNCSNGKEQCWKCQCLYPTLFSNPESGCTDQVGCTITINNQEVKGNIVGSVFNKDFKDKIWDPLKGQDATILRNNPMDAEFSRPMWVCDCPKGTVRYPNDPYNCHPDPCCGSNKGCSISEISDLKKSFKCTSNKKDTITDEECSTFFEDPSVCSCSCNCAYYDNSILLKSGRCYPKDILCKPGEYVDGKCECGTGTSYATNCLNVIDTDLKQYGVLPEICIDENNPLGQQCWDVCGGNPCGNPDISTCSRDPNTNKAICTCKDPKLTAEDCNGKEVNLQRGGDKCQTLCLPKDAVNWYTDGSGRTKPCSYPHPCCSGSSRDCASDGDKAFGYYFTCCN